MYESMNYYESMNKRQITKNTYEDERYSHLAYYLHRDKATIQFTHYIHENAHRVGKQGASDLEYHAYQPDFHYYADSPQYEDQEIRTDCNVRDHHRYYDSSILIAINVLGAWKKSNYNIQVLWKRLENYYDLIFQEEDS